MKYNVIEKDTEVILTVSHDFTKRDSRITASCIIPISYELEKFYNTNLTFTISDPDKHFYVELINGVWDVLYPYTAYDFKISFCSLESCPFIKLLSLVTPEKLRNQGYASCILDITNIAIEQYNKIINLKLFKQLKNHQPIRKIIGIIGICDIGNRLNPEQLINFYNKHGYLIDDKNNIIKSF